ncbi:Y-family DNA polymerase [Crenobacter cavernae]|uniref:Y-family DNA polymerase n=1 Tax=Crenobacter cavernae TaxID=2290923 RepID=A0A345Y238_9NEIS|nr:Y-family DNA polymerase [Crenobacter cavernae]AXK37990.1 Y-family DNA polymerase [Crenobacter cavernae]
MLFALVDCDNFYASVEMLFDPTLAGRPLVVLSNNLGCVIARSREAKALGIPMGAAWFQLEPVARQAGIVAMASNYTLYGDLSDRDAEVLRQFGPIERYSIDEAFLDLSSVANVPGADLTAYGQEIRRLIARWLGLPVCVGIAQTKTLAELANRSAKKGWAGEDGVCDFTQQAQEALDELFGSIAVDEVWGVGPRIAIRLHDLDIRTVRELRDADSELVRARFGVPLKRTVLELRGISCLGLDQAVHERQQIMCGRTFGHTVYDLPNLREAVRCYMARAGEKLRAQDSLAGAVHLYLRTKPSSPEDKPRMHGSMVPLPEPSADTRVLTAWALKLLALLYRPGYGYQKAAVMLSELRPKRYLQGSLFGPCDDALSDALMQAVDRRNRQLGRTALQQLSDGPVRPWHQRRGRRSPEYTTSWDDLPTVMAR